MLKSKFSKKLFSSMQGSECLRLAVPEEYEDAKDLPESLLDELYPNRALGPAFPEVSELHASIRQFFNALDQGQKEAVELIEYLHGSEANRISRSFLSFLDFFGFSGLSFVFTKYRYHLVHDMFWSWRLSEKTIRLCGEESRNWSFENTIDRAIETTFIAVATALTVSKVGARNKKDFKTVEGILARWDKCFCAMSQKASVNS